VAAASSEARAEIDIPAKKAMNFKKLKYTMTPYDRETASTGQEAAYIFQP
jgi:hypothetical protein